MEQAIKIILIFTMNIFNYTSFEDFLKKDISNIENTIGVNFEVKNYAKENSKIKFYTPYNYETFDFYTIPSKHISVITKDDDKTVESITIHFNSIINRSFYDAFIAHYGEPDKILIIKNKQLEDEATITDDIGSWQGKKYTIDLREGVFEENPLYIIWEKDDYQIKAFLRHEQNISEITFSLPKVKNE